MQIVTARMAREGVLEVEEGGRPRSRQSLATRSDQGSWQIEVTADLSPIGLPGATPMTATTRSDGSVSWSFGKALIRSLPGEWTPEEAGEGLGEHLLRLAYRRSLELGRADGRGF